jgi:RNA polymerase sigma-70 factor (ECF subfamily)
MRILARHRFEHPEIADMLGCSVGTSKSQLHRARLKLRELLAESSRRRAAAKHVDGGIHSRSPLTCET